MKLKTTPRGRPIKLRPAKLTKMIYIASAYSSNNPDRRLRACIEHARMEAVTKCIGVLHDRYPYAFIGPITQSHHTAPYTKTKGGGFEDWKTIDFTYISRSDEMWILADKGEAWKDSVGVKAEMEFCLANDIPIRFIHPETYEVRRMRLAPEGVRKMRLTKQKVKA